MSVDNNMSGYGKQFNELMKQVKSNNQWFKDLQGNDPLDLMDAEDVVQVQMNQYSNHILKAFSDALKSREGTEYYRQLELALIEVYEQLTGEDIAKGEL